MIAAALHPIPAYPLVGCGLVLTFRHSFLYSCSTTFAVSLPFLSLTLSPSLSLSPFHLPQQQSHKFNCLKWISPPTIAKNCPAVSQPQPSPFTHPPPSLPYPIHYPLALSAPFAAHSLCRHRPVVFVIVTFWTSVFFVVVGVCWYVWLSTQWRTLPVSRFPPSPSHSSLHLSVATERPSVCPCSWQKFTHT